MAQPKDLQSVARQSRTKARISAKSASCSADHIIREKARDPQLIIQVQVRFGDGRYFDGALINVLKAIESEGSIFKASQHLGVPYRWAWGTVKFVNESFAYPAVKTHEKGYGGPPAVLTEFGRSLIEKFDELQTRTLKASAPTLQWFQKNTARG